jgi:periplasmic copper chaperone A
MSNRYVKKLQDRQASRQRMASGNAARLIGFGILAIALLLIAIGVAVAHESSAKGVTVVHPWARATPGGADVGAAYLEVKAAAGHGDRLVGAKSPVARAVELHSHVMEGGIARMRHVDAIAIPAGNSVVLKPSGYHLMLTGLKAPLKAGDLFKLTLVFEKAGPIEVEAMVEPIGATGPHDGPSGHAAEKASAQHQH